MSISIKVTSKISDIKNVWDSCLPYNHHLKSPHLQAFEDSSIENIESFYLLIFLKENLIGVAYLQKFLFKHKQINFNDEQKLISKTLDFLLPKELPILVCGNLFRIDFQGFYFINKLHKNFIFDAIKLFTKQNANCEPKGIILKDCEEVFVTQYCKHPGYQYFDGDITMEVFRRKNWITFIDYLNDLTKKYLQRAKKIIKSFEGIRNIQLTSEQIHENAEIINELYNNVVNKQTVQLCTVNANYFVQLKNDLEQNFEFHALYKDDIMVGFYTLILYQNEMETHFIGLDYEANKHHQIYFNILFLGIEKMIENKFNRLELGRTARDAKANVGAQARQIINYVYINNRIIRFALNHFLKSFNSNENKNIVNRNPLK